MQAPGPNSETLEELYRSLPRDVANTVRQSETRLIVPPTTKLIYVGKQPEHLITLCAGKVEISVPCRKQAIRLSMAGPGRIFGLRALVTGKLPGVEATCLTECELRLLPKSIFTSALNSHPQMYLAVAKLLTADLKLAEAYLKNRARRKLRGPERALLMASDHR